MLSPSLIWILALAASADRGPVGVRLTTSLVAERIPLVPLRGPIELVVDPLGARLELRLKTPQPALVAEVARRAGPICPQVIATGTGVELRCRTRRFEAMISAEGSKKYLDIQELRGLPWREGPGGPPFFHYEPFKTGLGAVCPGTNPVGRGECALLLGHQLEAATLFRSALDLGDGQMASLRLGDLALATGDPATALGWYRRTGTAGIFGRMARTRICEIEGTCLASTEVVRRVFDPRGLPDPLRAEMSVRQVRAEAFTGRFDSTTRMLWQMIRAGSLAGVCREGGEPICRRVLLEEMRQAILTPYARPDEVVDASATPATPGGAPGTGKETIAEKAAAVADKAAAVADKAGTAVVNKAAAGVEKAATAVVDKAAAVVDKAAAEKPPAVEKPPVAEKPGVDKSVPAEKPAVAVPGEPSVPEMAIETYLALPQWNHGPLAAELSEAAAELARHIGAPVFGGNILAAVAPDVAAPMLPAHLLRAAELYLEGDDIARARLVVEYARTRVGKKMAARWIALDHKLVVRAAREEEEAAVEDASKITIDADDVARELAAARAASARARVARPETVAKSQGDRS